MLYRGADNKIRTVPPERFTRLVCNCAAQVVPDLRAPRLLTTRRSLGMQLAKRTCLTPCLSIGLSVDSRTRVDDLSPIQVSAIQCHDQHLGSCDIGCNRHVVLIAHTHQLVFDLAGASAGTRISEVQEHIDLIISHTRSDLLFAALLSRKQLFNLQAGRFGNILGSNAGCAQIVLTEHAAVSDTKLCHQFFFHVACNDSYLHSVSLPYSDQTSHNLHNAEWKPIKLHIIITRFCTFCQ